MSVTLDLPLNIFKDVFKAANLFVRERKHYDERPQATHFHATDLSGTRELMGTDLLVTPDWGNDIIFSFYKNGELLDVKHTQERTDPWSIASWDHYPEDSEALQAHIHEVGKDGDCIDNYRVAAVDDPDAMHAYEHIQNSGLLRPP